MMVYINISTKSFPASLPAVPIKPMSITVQNDNPAIAAQLAKPQPMSNNNMPISFFNVSIHCQVICKDNDVKKAKWQSLGLGIKRDSYAL